MNSRPVQQPGLRLEVSPDPASILPSEFNWHDHIVMLLHVAAEIEHSLMLEYLFAAYSLGGPHVPDRYQARVRRWQEVILGIAKEEMGHLITVQNILTLLGGPVNLVRQDYPWDVDFYPFGFSLRRFSRETLATFVCAESPAEWRGPRATLVKGLAQAGSGQTVNRVGVLYERLVALLSRRDLLPDACFDPSTLPFQASFGLWGRGYASGQRGQEAGNLPTTESPIVLVFKAADREGATAALSEIGEQGEAVDSDFKRQGADGQKALVEESHFERFLKIFKELERIPAQHRAFVARKVGPNPSTAYSPDKVDRDCTWISEPQARQWAHLLNLRYRMLLVSLSHAYRYPTPESQTTGVKGVLVNRTFAEMYNLRAISGQLVQLPVAERGRGGWMSGPPFESPYTLDLPDREQDRWNLHRDMYEAARISIQKLQVWATGSASDYLNALIESDRAAVEQVNRIVASGPRVSV